MPTQGPPAKAAAGARDLEDKIHACEIIENKSPHISRSYRFVWIINIQTSSFDESPPDAHWQLQHKSLLPTPGARDSEERCGGES